MKRLCALPAALLVLFLAGCSSLQNASLRTESLTVQGSVHGGQQPVSGAQIQLYTVGTTADQSAATPLLATPAVTQGNGSFSFTLSTPCPAPAALVYLAATGGNPGLGPATNNAAIVGLAAIGTCADLSHAAYFSINEVTTVAFANALTPFIASASAVGASSANSSRIAAGFALATQYASSLSGLSPGNNLPSGYTAPQAAIYTLADIVAPCINSSGSDNNCAALFSYTTPSGAAAPTDILQALLNIANNPSLNTSSLFQLVSAQSPFQPPLAAAPASYALALIPGTTTGAVTLNPASITFNPASVGLPQGTQFLTLTNSTSAAIPAPSFAVSGTSQADFSAAATTGSCSFILPPGAACTFGINFVPSATGTRTATFTVTSGATVLSTSLAGTGNTNTDTASLTVAGLQAVYAPGTAYDLQLRNYGNNPINFSNIGIYYTRSNFQTFTQTNNCAPQLYSQSVCTIHLTVSGVAAIGGYSSAALVLTDDLAPGIQTYPINQYPDQGSYPNYGGWVVGSSSPATQGSSDGTSQPRIGDNNNFRFSSSGSLCGTIIHGNYYCNTSVAFTPMTTGPLSTYLFAGSYSVNLTGYGLAPGAYLRSNFAASVSVPYGQTSSVGGSVGNYGSTAVNLLIPTITGPDAAAFSLGTSGACTVSPGGSCNYLLKFTPTHTGDSYANLVVNDSTGAFHLTQVLDVVAVPSLGSISPSSLQFPNTVMGTTSSTLSATISSAYNLGITATAATAPFAVVGSSTCTSTPCTLSYTFTPSNAYGSSNSLTIKDTNGNVLGTLSLSGTGTAPPSPPAAPAVTLSPTSFTFPSRPVGSTSISQTGTIQNSGNATLNLSGLTLTGTNATDYALSSACGTTLAAGATCSYSLSFSPSASGTRTASVTFASNAGTSPNSVPVTGTAQ